MTNDEIDADILDDVTIRFSVQAEFDLMLELEQVQVEACFCVTVGIYSGKPNQSMIAEQINGMGVQAENIQRISSQNSIPEKEEIATIITNRGVCEGDIRSMQIEEVLINEISMAISVENH